MKILMEKDGEGFVQVLSDAQIMKMCQIKAYDALEKKRSAEQKKKKK
jgi:ribosomal protein L24E